MPFEGGRARSQRSNDPHGLDDGLAARWAPDTPGVVVGGASRGQVGEPGGQFNIDTRPVVGPEQAGLRVHGHSPRISPAVRDAPRRKSSLRTPSPYALREANHRPRRLGVLEDRAAWRNLDRGHSPAVQHQQPITVLTPQEPVVNRQCCDGVIDDNVHAGRVRIVVGDVQAATAGESDP
jgi:hypothetical protein